jgi:hypothetical protein
MPVFHRLPYYALYGHPNILDLTIYEVSFNCQEEKLVIQEKLSHQHSYNSPNPHKGGWEGMG